MAGCGALVNKVRVHLLVSNHVHVRVGQVLVLVALGEIRRRLLLGQVKLVRPAIPEVDVHDCAADLRGRYVAVQLANDPAHAKV